MDRQVQLYEQWEYDQNFLRELRENRNDEKFIARRFTKPLKFGTAGLRSVMGCGWNAMNSATVQRATQGVCDYYIDHYGFQTAQKMPVIIGFDARHNSQWFAHIAAAVFASRGIPVFLSGSYTATPLTPYLVKKHGALCGIQITASHNPAADNGYKLYDSNGVQIIPPVDSEIHRRIVAYTEPWPEVTPLLDISQRRLKNPHKLISDPVDAAWEAYQIDLASSLGLIKENLSNTTMKIVYTAMHGVGYRFVHDFLVKVLCLPEASFHSVSKQQEPDPDFPTVSYPNPEEEGALNLAMEHADSIGGTLIIANDPDADRFAAAEKVDGKWRKFSGDELGAIFAMIMLQRALRSGIPRTKMLMINSAVSSRFLSRFCEIEECTHLESLTGFKWLMNVALKAERESGFHLCLAYEEAIGYGVTSVVPDKDGVSASAIFVTKACQLHDEGSSMYQFLQEGLMKYGFFATYNSYYRCSDPSAQAAVLENFRKDGYPTHVGGYKISRIRDLKPHYDSSTPNKECDLPEVSDDMLTIYLESGAIITLRGSGTEPKFKYYSEMFHSSSTEEARSQLVECVEKVLQEMITGYEAYFSEA